MTGDKGSGRLVLALWLLLLAGAAPVIWVAGAPIHGDVELYRAVADEVRRGQMPYRHRHLEYPPYALPLFLLPSLWSRTEPGYQEGFAAAVIVADCLLKYLLLAYGFRHAQGVRGLVPLGVYCLTVPFIRYFYLQRYDIFPAVVTVAALGCAARGALGWAGALVAVGAGLKLYPALLGPVLWTLALRQGQGRRFAFGAGLALLPLGLLSFLLPWWRFLAFHQERGLQVESLWVSLLPNRRIRC